MKVRISSRIVNSAIFNLIVRSTFRSLYLYLKLEELDWQSNVTVILLHSLTPDHTSRLYLLSFVLL